MYKKDTLSMNKEYISVNLKSLTLQLKLFLRAQNLLKDHMHEKKLHAALQNLPDTDLLMKTEYDIIVIGAGLSSLMFLSKMISNESKSSILILEQKDSFVP